MPAASTQRAQPPVGTEAARQQTSLRHVALRVSALNHMVQTVNAVLFQRGWDWNWA